MMTKAAFDTFLKGVNLKAYRKLYSSVKILEMDMPKDTQAIDLLYRVYWEERKPLGFDEFYERYRKEKDRELKAFRKKTTMCKDCFERGLKARIYRTWAGLITQIHAGYVAEFVFGKGSVEMSRKLDSQGADIRVTYKGKFLNYQVKKTSHSGVMSRRPLPRKRRLEGKAIDLKYEVPTCLSDPKTKKGKFRRPYLRFLKDKRTTTFDNGFVTFTSVTFQPDKDAIDREAR
ncbi:MAG: TaqI family restriction endonuclease [bacterium]|nr:TaqI family restriction endonuclease [bacterium]